jgi:SAM-dependent methyltransferase
MSYASIPEQRSMALDHVRNAAYAAALQQIIRPDSVVLDLGAGTGVLGLIAARLGARRVYLVEPTDVIAVADEIVRANGLQHVVRCIQGRFEDITLPEPVDVIVSVMTGNFLLAEDLLGTLFRARDVALRPGGVLVPSEAEIAAVPVSAPSAYSREIDGWSAVHYGVDLGAARPYAANSVFFRVEGLSDASFLADPAVLASFDFQCAREAGLHSERTFEISRSGLCHGCVGWFNVKLGGSWLSTSPHAAATHWSPAFLPIDPPLEVERGERLTFALDRPASSEWTWSVRAGNGTRRHSTHLASPLTAATLKKASAGFSPSLNTEGRILADVLSMFDGARTSGAIAEVVHAKYRARFPSPQDAMDFVRLVARRYS